MNYLSVCSGIEAATCAWHPLGWRPWAFAQFDPDHDYKGGPDFPSRVLAHHYPDVPNLGDMTNFKEWPHAAVDVLVGGTPCQSFSVAGLREGLDDARGNLMLTFACVARKFRPRWLLWENVPGVLSSDGGRDFGSLLAVLTGRNVIAPVDGWKNSGVVPGIESAYGLAWRVLDAQYLGVAQRRRRVFVVGHAGDWRRAAAVLLERESLCGYPAPRRGSRQRVAGTVEAGAGKRRHDEQGTYAVDGIDIAKAVRTPTGGIDREDMHTLIPATVGALTDGAHMGGGATVKTPTPDESSLLPDIVSQAMSAKWSKGTSGPAGDEVANLIPVRTGGGFDADPIPFDWRAGGDTACGTSLDGCPPVRASDTVAIAFSGKDHGADAANDVSPTLRGMAHSDSHANGGGQVAVAFKASHYTREKDGAPSELAPPLSADADKGDQDTLIAFDTTQITHPDNRSRAVPGAPCHPLASAAHAPAVASAMQVRRLTPRECERLQGFRDDYTRIPLRSMKKKRITNLMPEDRWADNPDGTFTLHAADGPRYRALGNSMAVPVMRWLGRRIDMVDAIGADGCRVEWPDLNLGAA